MKKRHNSKTKKETKYPIVLIEKLKLSSKDDTKEINFKNEKTKGCSVVLERIDLKNVKPKNEEIILVNVKKNIVLPPELLQKVEVLKISKLIESFEGKTPKQFYKHCRQQLTNDVYDTANVLTIEQSHVPLWFDLRVGRITASSIYKASCLTPLNTNFGQKFLNGRNENMMTFPAGQRGTLLEDYVFKELLNEFSGLRKSGLFIDHEYPVIAASPDGSLRIKSIFKYILNSF